MVSEGVCVLLLWCHTGAAGNLRVLQPIAAAAPRRRRLRIRSRFAIHRRMAFRAKVMAVAAVVMAVVAVVMAAAAAAAAVMAVAVAVAAIPSRRAH